MIGPIAAHPVLSAAEMREWEERVFASRQAESRVVLESAGRALAQAVATTFPEGKVIGVAGAGNNGADTLVALRTLCAWGREVAFVPVGARATAGLDHGWELPQLELEEAIASEAVLLDGILGTGAHGPPRDAIRRVIQMLNESGFPIIAVDGPSGVDLTSGQVVGVAVRARLTVTFGALKQGLLLYPGRALTGTIMLAEIGLPPTPRQPSALLIDDLWARSRLPRIAPDAHKGSVGLVGIVAGRKGYGGAAIMSAMGALRAGCGGVRILSPECNRAAIHAAVPEAVVLERGAGGTLAELMATAALLVGPGMGLDSEAADLLQALLDRFPGPLALDADALTLLSRGAVTLAKEVAARCILTPHPGELARLLGTSVAEVLEDRFASIRALAERYDCAVLAKGAPSLVTAGEGPVLIGSAGHSGVATGGMGDTLGGVIAALLAGGRTPWEAGAVGLQLAGRAAEIAGRGRGLLPRDVAEAIPTALARLESSEASFRNPPFRLELPLPL